MAQRINLKTNNGFIIAKPFCRILRQAAVVKRYLSQKRFILLFSIAWCLLLSISFWRLNVYSSTPGAAASASQSWPTQSKLYRNPLTPTFVLFLHPHCPCSKATLGELDRLAVSLKNHATTHIVFFKPKGQSDDWVMESPLWKKALNTPAVNLVIDHDETESHLFGPKTSGQTFLYDESGKLVFEGGITPARGHMGDSDGRAAVLNYLTSNKKADQNKMRTPVYGCSLKNPERTISGSEKL